MQWSPPTETKRALLLDDPSCDLRHAGEVASFVGALDQHVTEIGHRDADEMLAAGLDVVPASNGTPKKTTSASSPLRSAVAGAP